MVTARFAGADDDTGRFTGWLCADGRARMSCPGLVGIFRPRGAGRRAMHLEHSKCR